jgi:hypothetical protein
MGVAILTQLVSGILLLTSKKAGMAISKIRLFSAILMVVLRYLRFHYGWIPLIRKFIRNRVHDDRGRLPK